MTRSPDFLWAGWRSRHVTKPHYSHPHMPNQRYMRSVGGPMPKNCLDEILVTMYHMCHEILVTVMCKYITVNNVLFVVIYLIFYK